MVVRSPWTGANNNGALQTTSTQANFVGGTYNQPRTEALYLDLSKYSETYKDGAYVRPDSQSASLCIKDWLFIYYILLINPQEFPNHNRN